MADINSLYNELLGRGADASGAAFYSGMGADQIRNALMASPEYQGRLASQQMQANQPQAAAGGFNNPAGYIPQSLLNSLGTDLQGALSGNFTPAADPWQGYAAQPQAPASSGMDAFNIAMNAANGNTGNYAPGSWQNSVATSVAALPGGGMQGMFDKQMSGFMDQMKAQQQAMLDQQKAFANSFNSAQQSQTPTFNFGQNGNGQWGLGSPTYSPTSKNGYGMGWGGSNPFKIGSF